MSREAGRVSETPDTLETWFKDIRYLLFDFGATLDVPGAHWLDRFLGHYQHFGIELTRPELDLAFSDATGRGYRAGERIYHYGLKPLLDLLVNWQIDYLLEHLPQKVSPSIRNFAGPIAERFFAESMAGYEHSRPILAALAARFRIGVVSNFYGNLEAVLQEAGLRPLIEAVIDSSRVGSFKPDPAIYQAALSALHAPSDQTAMVGDSIAKDCVPARALGLRTVWLNAAPIEYTHSIEAGADLIVRDLNELVEISLGAD
jgi:HAD superfamily hydrolase (TIGR01509 family)